MKSALRRELLSRRGALAPEDRRRMSEAIVERLLTLPVVTSASTLAGYSPMRDEADTLRVLEDRVRRGGRAALPRIDAGSLVFHRWSPGEPLERNIHGVSEPLASAGALATASLDAVIVPGVGFDTRGHRLGYGKGYYDRALLALPRQRRVGVAFEQQVVESLPAEAHDAPVGWLVTQDRTRRFED